MLVNSECVIDEASSYEFLISMFKKTKNRQRTVDYAWLKLIPPSRNKKLFVSTPQRTIIEFGGVSPTGEFMTYNLISQPS